MARKEGGEGLPATLGRENIKRGGGVHIGGSRSPPLSPGHTLSPPIREGKFSLQQITPEPPTHTLSCSSLTWSPPLPVPSATLSAHESRPTAPSRVWAVPSAVMLAPRGSFSSSSHGKYLLGTGGSESKGTDYEI